MYKNEKKAYISRENIEFFFKTERVNINRFIIKSLKIEGLILSVKRYELLHKSPVIELTFLHIDLT